MVSPGRHGWDASYDGGFGKGGSKRHETYDDMRYSRGGRRHRRVGYDLMRDRDRSISWSRYHVTKPGAVNSESSSPRIGRNDGERGGEGTERLWTRMGSESQTVGWNIRSPSYGRKDGSRAVDKVGEMETKWLMEKKVAGGGSVIGPNDMDACGQEELTGQESDEVKLLKDLGVKEGGGGDQIVARERASKLDVPSKKLDVSMMVEGQDDGIKADASRGDLKMNLNDEVEDDNELMPGGY